MILELPVVQKAISWKKKNRKALQELKNRDELDKSFQRAHELVFSQIDCLECANCCRTTGPLFIQEDITRIARQLKLKPGQFIEEYLFMDEDGDFVLQHLPCPFLDDQNLCSIYDHRPEACRQYPHTSQRGQSKIFNLTLKNIEICPAAFEIMKQVIEK